MPSFDIGAYEAVPSTVGTPPLTILHVWKDAPGPTYDGSTKMLAFLTLQDAIDVIPATLKNAYLVYVWEGTYITGGIIPAKSGTDLLRITIMGHPDATTRPIFAMGAATIIECNSEYVTIEGLTFYNSITGIDARNVVGGAGIIVTRNIFNGLTYGVRYGSSIANFSIGIYNNLFYANGYGIDIINSSKKPDVILVNNTMADNTTDVLFEYTGSPGTEVTSRDNVLAFNTIIFEALGGVSVSVNSNYDCYYNNINTISGGTITLTEGFENIKKDPSFKDKTNSDYSLSLVSVCINKGDPTNAAGLTTDILGNTRVVNGRIDIGAYERQPIEYELYTSYTILDEFGYGNVESIIQYNEKTQEWNWAGWDVDDLTYNTGTVSVPSPIGDDFKIVSYKKYWIKARQSFNESLLGITAKKDLNAEGIYALPNGAVVGSFVLGHGNISNFSIKDIGSKEDNSISLNNNDVFARELPLQKERNLDLFDDEVSTGTYAVDYKKGLIHVRTDLNNNIDTAITYNYLGDTLNMYDESKVFATPKMVNDLRIERIIGNTTDVTLSWSAITKDIYDKSITISYYEIYRGLRSRFIPSKGISTTQHVSVYGKGSVVAKYGTEVYGSTEAGILIATTTDISYVDVNVLLNDDKNYFYLVRAVSNNGIVADYSNMGYVFKIDITNLSNVSLMVPELTTMLTAADIISEINTSGSDPISNVSMIDTIANVSYNYNTGSGQSDFVLDSRFFVKLTFSDSKTVTYMTWLGSYDGHYSAFRAVSQKGAFKSILKPFDITAVIAE